MEGIIWMDGDPKKTMEQKITAAVACYQARFQRQPTVCQVNIETKCDEKMICGVQVIPTHGILKNDFFVGEEVQDDHC